jgi:hypothetical protein
VIREYRLRLHLKFIFRKKKNYSLLSTQPLIPSLSSQSKTPATTLHHSSLSLAPDQQPSLYISKMKAHTFFRGILNIFSLYQFDVIYV